VYTPYVIANVGTTSFSDPTSPYAIPQSHEVSVNNGLTASNSFNYSFVSPYRAILSGTYILKGRGFITADYEYVGYNTMRYIYPTDDGYGNSYQDEESSINQELKNTFKGTSNFRVGAEGLITKFFMARLGFGYYGNPYKESDMDGSRIDVSGGLGFRTQNFFVDIALVHSMYKSEFQPYNVDYSYVMSGPAVAMPVSTTNFSINNLALTVGCKF
jgi:hypothetical protein